eukprot:1118031-Karenia_brevis.AAC.1
MLVAVATPPRASLGAISDSLGASSSDSGQSCKVLEEKEAATFIDGDGLGGDERGLMDVAGGAADRQEETV